MKQKILLISLMVLLTTLTTAQVSQLPDVTGFCDSGGEDCLPMEVNYTRDTLPELNGGNITGLSNTTGLKTNILGLAKTTLIKIACLLLILIPLITIRPPHIGILFSIIVMDFIVLIIPEWFTITNDVYVVINTLGLIILLRGAK